MLAIGLMSGTSMDGIDAALIYTDGLYKIEEKSHFTLSYEPHVQILLKAAEYAVQKNKGDLVQTKENFSHLFQEFLFTEIKCQSSYWSEPPTFETVIELSTELHLKAIRGLLEKTKLQAQDIQIMGYHGQTVFHDPANKITVQLGNPQWLAIHSKIPAVFNFRQADINASGQGAPLAPIYHQALAMRDQLFPLAILNCGGIANITIISGSKENELLGFDTGPGNILLDKIVRQKTAGKEHFDRDGIYGMQGKVIDSVLALLFKKAVFIDEKNYFELPTPKSLDSSNLYLIPELEALSLPDACRTLATFTAESIVRSLDQIEKSQWPNQWVLGGGGWKNPVITQELTERLIHKIGASVRVLRAKEVGWNSDALEAQLMAYLAVRKLKNLPTSLPSVTKAKKAVVGGDFYRA